MNTVDDHLQANERRHVVLAFSYAFSTAGAYVIGRSVADALFLARVGPAWLPLMYLITACFVGLLAIGFLHFATRRSLKQVILTVLVLLSFTSLVMCQLVQTYDHALGLLICIYLLAEIRGSLNTIQYGILMNELFAGSPNHRQIAGLLGAGATLAGIVFGVGLAFEVHQLGTVHMLYIVAGLEGLAMIPILLLPKGESETPDQRPIDANMALNSMRVDYEAVEMASGISQAAKSPYVRNIAVLVTLAVVVGTLIEFQWKNSVAASYLLKEDQMTRFFGLFYAVTNLAVGAIQILLTGKILHYLGTRPALLVFPAALLASTLAVLFSSFDRVLLSAATLAKGCDVFKRSVNDPAIWMMFAPLPTAPRRRAITFVSGIIKPSAEAIAAILIVAFSAITSPRGISYVALALLCLWLFLAMRRRPFAPTIKATLGDDSVKRTNFDFALQPSNDAK